MDFQNFSIAGYYKILKLNEVVESDFAADLNGDGVISNEAKTLLIYFVKKQDGNVVNPILYPFSTVKL